MQSDSLTALNEYQLVRESAARLFPNRRERNIKCRLQSNTNCRTRILYTLFRMILYVINCL